MDCLFLFFVFLFKTSLNIFFPDRTHKSSRFFLHSNVLISFFANKRGESFDESHESIYRHLIAMFWHFQDSFNFRFSSKKQQKLVSCLMVIFNHRASSPHKDTFGMTQKSTELGKRESFHVQRGEEKSDSLNKTGRVEKCLRFNVALVQCPFAFPIAGSNLSIFFSRLYTHFIISLFSLFFAQFHEPHYQLHKQSKRPNKILCYQTIAYSNVAKCWTRFNDVICDKKF